MAQCAQTSMALDSGVIAPGFASNGSPATGQVASLTSTNNFINFCLTSTLAMTNGKQVTAGSCNQAPVGLLPGATNMPSAKFVYPTNGATIAAGTTFTVQLAVRNLVTGSAVNAQNSYLAAPQQLNSAGQIIGHSHVVIEKLTSLTSTTALDPRYYVYFAGLHGVATSGVLSVAVTGGLAAGAHRICSLNTAANHQPVVVSTHQHGSPNDCVHFTVS
ncbi:hypothetical protein FA15DRAFT_710076 [Coprinopsis marcescibilis]|uniref:Uncharacterized protein n=1 Tax=Coprinopsis marcescibilis TaxID=230819 RepID=A0A5C3KDX1_COPMA|nr:hypothetical protein FA15DRAFT_710076 [Coprinopsis marcescibilis]